jgi:hypothetical protein
MPARKGLEGEAVGEDPRIRQPDGVRVVLREERPADLGVAGLDEVRGENALPADVHHSVDVHLAWPSS